MSKLYVIKDGLLSTVWDRFILHPDKVIYLNLDNSQVREARDELFFQLKFGCKENINYFNAISLEAVDVDDYLQKLVASGFISIDEIVNDVKPKEAMTFNGLQRVECMVFQLKENEDELLSFQ